MILEKAENDLNIARNILEKTYKDATVAYEAKPPRSDREEVYKKVTQEAVSAYLEALDAYDEVYRKISEQKK